MDQNLFQLCMERRAVCAIGAPLAAVMISKLVFDFIHCLVIFKTNWFITQFKFILTIWTKLTWACYNLIALLATTPKFWMTYVWPLSTDLAFCILGDVQMKLAKKGGSAFTYFLGILPLALDKICYAARNLSIIM